MVHLCLNFGGQKATGSGIPNGRQRGPSQAAGGAQLDRVLTGDAYFGLR
jgi:hypothetical protein